jgi:hypothetical protein
MVLPRQLGFFGAVTMGLGAMMGTGVFVVIGVAAGIAGAAIRARTGSCSTIGQNDWFA